MKKEKHGQQPIKMHTEVTLLYKTQYVMVCFDLLRNVAR